MCRLGDATTYFSKEVVEQFWTALNKGRFTPLHAVCGNGCVCVCVWGGEIACRLAVYWECRPLEEEILDGSSLTRSSYRWFSSTTDGAIMGLSYWLRVALSNCPPVRAERDSSCLCEIHSQWSVTVECLTSSFIYSYIYWSCKKQRFSMTGTLALLTPSSSRQNKPADNTFRSDLCYVEKWYSYRRKKLQFWNDSLTSPEQVPRLRKLCLVLLCKCKPTTVELH